LGNRLAGHTLRGELEYLAFANCELGIAAELATAMGEEVAELVTHSRERAQQRFGGL
jgi:hypothetical protein